jgi:L-ascorbate metabolism protein UlaG (beta-lactamase superfamily)
VAGAEMVIVSHLHNDHFDEVAQRLISKDLPLFCQLSDEATIAEVGFRRVTPVREEVVWEGITITRTHGTHGTGAWGDRLNPVSGFVLRAEGEPTVE